MPGNMNKCWELPNYFYSLTLLEEMKRNRENDSKEISHETEKHCLLQFMNTNFPISSLTLLKSKDDRFKEIMYDGKILNMNLSIFAHKECLHMAKHVINNLVEL